MRVALLFLAAASRENPISKVVHLLQGLQEEVETEGQREKALYDKFMCFCKENDGQLKSDVANQRAHISELESLLQELTASNTQLEQEITELQQDIDENQKAVAEARSVRDKEEADYNGESAELQSSIEALGKAIPAVQQGQGNALAQLGTQLAPRVIQSDRDQPLIRALLQEDSSQPSSQILGILQQMEDNFKEDLAQAHEAERKAKNSFAELERAKKAEITSSETQRDDKKARVADQKLSLATSEEDLEDTKSALASDTAFAGDLAQSCADKTAQWEERQQTRGQEIEAISEAIRILNEDDSRDLFKKTLPSPSFVQMSMRTSMVMRASVKFRLRAKARALEKVMRSTAGSSYGSSMHTTGMSAIVESMKSDQAPDKFLGIKKMVSEMVTNLQNEQDDDDKHYAYCQDELTAKAAKKAKLHEQLEQLDNKIENFGSAIKSTDEEMAALKQEIAALDKSVADATEARKKEHAEYTAALAELNLAVDLLKKAKGKLAAFYAPAIAPQPTGFLGLGLSFVQVRRSRDVLSEFLQEELGTQAKQAAFASASDGARPTPPPTFGDSYKKNGKSAGVMELLTQLAHESELQITEAKHNEKSEQAHYETLMTESQASREAKANAIADKETERVRLLEVLGEAKDEKDGDQAEFKALVDNLAALHESCSFLVDNYDFRKKARSDELDGLKQGLSVLSGANYGPTSLPDFLQR